MIRLIKSTFYKEKETKENLCKFITNSKQLSFSNQCKSFEKNYAKWQGKKYCVFFNSGSSANLAIIQTLLNTNKINKNDKIAFSSLTWSTNVMPIIQLGLKAIPIDINKKTLNVSINELEKTYNKEKFKVFFITNLLGFCDEIDKIKAFCKKNNIILLEDNCESMGTIYKGKKLGNYGEMSSFSTYVGHHMSTIEGGMVCTDDEEYYKMLIIVRAHGWDRNLNEKHKNEIKKEYNIDSSFYSNYTFYELGYNLRPTEINGFLGNEQLKYLDEIIKKRNENFLRFIKAIELNPDFENIQYKHIELVSNFAVPLICKTKEIKESYIKKFNNNNIEIRPIVGGNITEQPFWKKIYGTNKEELTNSTYIHHNGFYFGNSPEYTDKEINKILSILKK